MRKVTSGLIILGAAVAYYFGVVVMIGLAARLSPLPSVDPAGAALAHLVAVAAAAAPVALVVLMRFGNKAFAASLLVATPSVADLLWSLSQQGNALNAGENAMFVLAKDALLLALAPAAMTAVFSRLLRGTAGLRS